MTTCRGGARAGDGQQAGQVCRGMGWKVSGLDRGAKEQMIGPSQSTINKPASERGGKLARQAAPRHRHRHWPPSQTSPTTHLLSHHASKHGGHGVERSAGGGRQLAQHALVQLSLRNNAAVRWGSGTKGST